MWLWDWLSGKRRQRARLGAMASTLVNATLSLRGDCVRSHFKLDGVDPADLAGAQAMVGSAYLGLVLLCAEDAGLPELATLARERFASLDDTAAVKWPLLNAVSAVQALVHKEVGSLAEDVPRDRLLACIETLMKRPAIERYGETATYFKAGSVCDESVVAEEIVQYFEKTRLLLLELQRVLRR